MLAGISVDYYTRLKRGNAQVLRRACLKHSPARCVAKPGQL
jgi:hypothetical protein